MWIRTRRAYLAVERWGLSAERGGGIPSYVIESDPVQELKIGEKHLFIRPLSSAAGRRFRRAAAVWLARNLARTNSVRWLVWNEIQDEQAMNQALSTMAELLQEKDYTDTMRELLARTILKDNAVNPERITRRYLLKHASDTDLAKILHLVFAYNCGEAVKKNFQSALQALLSLSPGMIATPSLPSWREGATVTSSTECLYPASPFLPGQELSLPNENADESRG
jgi:hypothetical protein